MYHTRRLLYALLVILPVLLAGCRFEAPYRTPAAGLREADLAGTWRAGYSGGTDTLILRADGTFQQHWRENLGQGYVYVFETSWERFWLERFADGRVWLHLPGARYFVGGVTSLLRDDFGRPCPSQDLACYGQRTPFPRAYGDPVGDTIARMDGELILNVLDTAYGETVLAQMMESADQAFILLWTQRAIRFVRIGPP